MASRHRSRELAAQMSYQWALDPSSMGDPRSVDRFWQEQALSADDNRAYFEILVKGLVAKLLEIDGILERHLKSWKLDRLEKVDLALLRVAVFEMLFFKGSDPADPIVVINEFVEVAKKFGTPKSAAFVNGILDAIAKEAKLISAKGSV